MATFIRLVNVLDVSADELLKDEVNRADYLVDAEISSRLAGLKRLRDSAVLNILDRILEQLPYLASE